MERLIPKRYAFFACSYNSWRFFESLSLSLSLQVNGIKVAEQRQRMRK